MTQGTLTLAGRPRRTCRRKIAYKTERHARRAALKMIGLFWQWFEPYPCSICPDWHIGRQHPSHVHDDLLFL